MGNRPKCFNLHADIVAYFHAISNSFSLSVYFCQRKNIQMDEQCIRDWAYVKELEALQEAYVRGIH